MRPIDADEFEVVSFVGVSDEFAEGARTVLEKIDAAPILDYKDLVPQGEWKDKWKGLYANQNYKCSICGESAFGDGKRWYLTDFCPNCGARMK